MIQETNENILRGNKYILENIFKFYILKYITKFLQSRDNNKKKEFDFHNFAEHRLRSKNPNIFKLTLPQPLDLRAWSPCLDISSY